MKTKKVVTTVLILSTLALFGTGCGKNRSGSYTLNETLSTVTTTATCQQGQATFNIVDNGTTINGSASNSCFIQTLTGTDAGNQITGVSLTLAPISNTTSYGGYPSGYGAQQPQQNCIFTGTLNVVDNQVSGNLTLQNAPAPAPTTTPQQQGPQNYCASTVSISGTYTK